MSEKFEEIVLKKLEKLDVLEDKVENVILRKLEKLDVLDERNKSMEDRMINFELELKDTKEIVKNLNDKFTVFDFEINKKIDTLFDAI